MQATLVMRIEFTCALEVPVTPLDVADAGVALEAEDAVVVTGAADDVLLAADLGGATGLGASTPAVPEPKPNFCKLGASILPLELRPLSD